MSKEVVQEIYATFGSPEEPQTAKIPLEKVKKWMSSDDLDALGALHAALSSAGSSERISPPIDFEDYFHFVRSYLERCLRENPDSEWASSRYEAGWEVARWIQGLWNDSSVRRSALAELKAWLADLYRSGDDAVRRCLVDATLEHLFEQPDFVSYFQDWTRDSVLAIAYTEACLWIDKGRRSDLDAGSGD